MIKKYLTTIGVLVAICIIPCLAVAKPLIAISVKAEMNVVVKEGGKSVTKKVQAKDVVPGDVIFYTVTYRNDGNEKATNAVIDNPISKATSYMAGSANGESEDGITFSIDKGKTYNKPTMLFYQVTDKQGTVGFKAIVK